MSKSSPFTFADPSKTLDQPSSVSTEKAIDSSDLIAHNIEAIAEHQAAMDRSVSRYQIAIESATSFLGRPLFLYLILAFVAIWIAGNLIAAHCHHAPWDPAPFYWLQGLVGLSALLMTTIVLITQNRQSHIAARHAQLDLQISLLAEQKIAKLIGLMEELRRDSPDIRDRCDPEADAMTEAADPHAVLNVLEETLERAQFEVEELDAAVDAEVKQPADCLEN